MHTTGVNGHDALGNTLQDECASLCPMLPVAPPPRAAAERLTQWQTYTAKAHLHWPILVSVANDCASVVVTPTYLPTAPLQRARGCSVFRGHCY